VRSTPSSSRACLALALLVAGAPRGWARVDPPVRLEDPIARERYRVGAQALERAAYDEAIAAFKAGYEQMPLPTFLYNLGLAYRLKGDCAEAARYYRRYLERNPDAANADRVERRIAEMDLCAAKAAPAPATASATAPAAQPAAPGPSPPRRWPLFLAAGLGLAVGVGGGAWEGIVDRRYRELLRTCAPGCDTSERAGLVGQDIAAWALVGVGAATLAVSAIWLITTYSKARSPVRARAAALEVVF